MINERERGRRGRKTLREGYRSGYVMATGFVSGVGMFMTAMVWWRDTLSSRWPAASYDTYVYYFPNLAYLRRSVTQGFGLLWNGLQNCGQPAFGNLQIPTLDPTAWVFLIVEPPVALALVQTLALLIGALGMVVLARRLRLHPVAGAVGSIALITADWTAGLSLWQPPWLVAYMWMPWIIACAERALRIADASSAIRLGAILTLQLLAGAPQLTLFTYEVLALRCLWELATRRRLGAGGGVLTVACGAALPLGLAAVKLLPAFEMSVQSIRGEPLSETDLFVGALTPTWSEFRRQLTDPLSNGVVSRSWFLGLAVLALITRSRRRLVGFYLAAAALFFALSFDGPVLDFYRTLPFGEFFRLPVRFRCVTAMLLAFLTAIGTHNLILALRGGGGA